MAEPRSYYGTLALYVLALPLPHTQGLSIATPAREEYDNRPSVFLQVFRPIHLYMQTEDLMAPIAAFADADKAEGGF